MVSVSHESVGIRVFLVEMVGEIRVVGVGHPTVGVLPRSAVN